MTEIYKIPQGKIIVGYCDEKLSIGLLELNPGQELLKHNRPVSEELFQMVGTCVMKLFDGDNLIKEITLNEGNILVIPANQFHIHSNPSTERSITLWKFEGNIIEIIENIRSSSKVI